MEIFPSIEIIDRTYVPVDQQVRFAIPVEIVPQDIELALQGKFVTRVIYLENPHNSLPTARHGRPIVVYVCRAAIRWQWPTSWAGR